MLKWGKRRRGKISWGAQKMCVSGGENCAESGGAVKEVTNTPPIKIGASGRKSPVCRSCRADGQKRETTVV